MHIRRCRDCLACFSFSKFWCVDQFRNNNARPHIKNLSILFLLSAQSPVDPQTSWVRCHDSTRVCSRGSTIVTVFLLASLPLHSCLFNRFYMRPPDLWTTWRRPITWHRRWWIFTGCLSSSASTINCVATFTTYPLVMPLLTYPIRWSHLPMSHHFPGCGHHPAVIMSSRGRGW